jgi:transcription antitermination protein NusB
MKSSQDPRHQHRIDSMQKLFSLSFTDGQVNDAEDVKTYVEAFPTIDDRITKAAPDWPIDKIAKIDLAILRLSLYELLIQPQEPAKVVIDEAIELAKEFGNPNSPQFINGVLGTIYKTL